MSTLSSISIQLIRDLLKQLEAPSALDQEEVVHQARVLTKRLRAAWHLAQPICQKKQAQQARCELRSLSALLAPSRDRSVQTALATNLLQLHPDRSATSPNLSSLFPETTNPSPLSLACITGPLVSQIAAWENVHFGKQERKVLRYRCRLSLKTAKDLTRQSLKIDDAEQWHSWRKAIKRLRYQREFLALIYPRELGTYDLRLRRLGTRLGDHNDLAIFSAQLHSAALKTPDLNRLKKPIAIEERKIKSNCRRLGRRLFGK
ncbi:MAG: CHAD domain-containing protein [Verrucomicrobiales bacterium]|nr:CHAD domain-containing protein [Verrucomicrobiales bacterium]